MFTRSFLLAIACCAGVVNAQAQNFVAPDFEQGTILVCKAKQCVQTNHNMSREYLYNQLSALASANIGQYIDVCEGNAATHQCVQKGISFPIRSAVIQSNATISKARMIDARPVEGVPSIDLIIDYDMRAGDTFPRCQTALSRLGTAHAGTAEMMSPQFSCQVTETGNTVFSVSYHIDYLDFDQGVMGAFYTVAADKTLTGTGTGYVLLDFKKGVQMDGNETFPYPEQQAALLSGEVETFDTPAEIEAIWMKPTPFLNLLTPTFAPNNCNTFEGGCSAQMLNNPALAVPPAQEKLNRLTPPNVASTTGLIEQKVSVENVLPTERRTVITKKIISENGQPVYSEAQTRHFVRQTPDAELVEDKSKAQKEVSGVTPQDMPQKSMIMQEGMARAVQNAEKEYAAMKQFEAQTQQPQQTQQEEKDTVSSIQQPTPLAQPMKQTNVEIIVPEGIALSEAERAYIEQIAMEAENNATQPAGQMPQSIVSPTAAVQQQTPQLPVINNIPVVAATNGYAQQMPIQAVPQTAPLQPQVDLSLLPPEQPQQASDTREKEAESFLGATWKTIQNLIYF